MFVMDMPYVPVEEPVAVEMLVAASDAGSSGPGHDYLMQECVEVAMTGSPLQDPNQIDPIGMIRLGLQLMRHTRIDVETAAGMKVTVLDKPHRGTLIRLQGETGYTAFTYKSEPNYMGQDKASFLVEFEGIRYKVATNIEVLDIVDDDPTVCDESQYKLIKINPPNSFLNEFDADLSLEFFNLKVAAQGQVKPRGINLADNSDGFGWGVDLTPGLNEELLPTPERYEWSAEPGSEALGRIDRLKVIPHDAARPIDHSLILAQMSDDQAIEQSTTDQRTWIDGDADMLKGFERYTRDGKEWLKEDRIYAYSPEGELGMPSLLVNMTIDYIRLGGGDGKPPEILANQIALARAACLFLDLEKGEAGAWGPACRIARFLTMPEGKFEKSNKPDARNGDFVYTPPRVGTDMLRFVLENGAGNQVDVTVNLVAFDFTGASRSDDGSRALTLSIQDGQMISSKKVVTDNLSRDTNTKAYLSTLLAQADTEKLLIEVEQSKPTWIERSHHSLRTFQNYMRIGPERLRGDLYDYKLEGELGIPKLELSIPVDYYTAPIADDGEIIVHPMVIGLASSACLCLDVEARKAGAWGPECKISRFITLPEGKLEKWDDPRAEEGDYSYTPPRIGTDVVRFILDNGRGRQVDVTAVFSAEDNREGSLERYTPELVG